MSAAVDLQPSKRRAAPNVWVGEFSFAGFIRRKKERTTWSVHGFLAARNEGPRR